MSNTQDGPIMAIDVGQARIGLALSDPLRIIAQPYGVIEAQPPLQALERIAEIAGEHSVGKILVGWPISLRGRKTASTEAAEEFADSLRRQLPDIPVELYDERLTTVEAESMLIESNVSRAKRKQKVDKIAAALILKSYLEKTGREQ